MLTIEHMSSIPMVSKVPTIILGMDVSHGSAGQSDIPSIAAVLFFSLFELFILCFVQGFYNYLVIFCRL